MVDVAQQVRAPGCGPGGRGFESHLPPQINSLIIKTYDNLSSLFLLPIFPTYNNYCNLFIDN